MPWAIKRVSDNALDGHREYLMGRVLAKLPVEFRGHTTMVFRTRAEARAFIKKEWGYIANRPDLKCEPHGWKMPRAVRVNIDLTEA